MRLKKFQKEGVARVLERLKIHSYAFLADEPGLGKTPQSVVISRKFKGRILVVCPASVKYNWLREIQIWGDDDHGTSASIVPSEIVKGSRYVIINYDLLNKWMKPLMSVDWSLIIFDEAHYLKSLKAQRTTAARKLAAGKKILLLTGTPIMNSPKEMIDLMSWVEKWDNKELWLNYFHYLDAKKVPISFYNKTTRSRQTRQIWDFSGFKHEGQFAAWVNGILIRRTMKEVLPQLEKETRQIVEIDCGNETLLAEERILFEEQVRRLGIDKAILEYAENYSDRRLKCARTKLPGAIEFIEGLLGEGRKVVVFAWHREIVLAISSHFGREAVTIMGDTRLCEREEAIRKFKAAPGVKLLVGNIHACGVGVDGLQHASHTVVFVETTFVPSEIDQAIGRLRRMGQEFPVNAYFIALRNSVDTEILKIILKKEKIIEKILDREHECVTV